MGGGGGKLDGALFLWGEVGWLFYSLKGGEVVLLCKEFIGLGGGGGGGGGGWWKLPLCPPPWVNSCRGWMFIQWVET